MEKVRILAVNNHPEIQEGLQMLLSSEGDAVMKAAHGVEVLVSEESEKGSCRSNGTVMEHIRKLAVKREEDSQNPKPIIIGGRGYRLV